MTSQRPEIEEFNKKVKQLAQNLTYPITTRADLTKALGGDDAMFHWEHVSHRAGQAVQSLPDHYFPIESEEDLIAKAANLEVLRPGNKLGHVRPAQERPRTPGRTPPQRESKPMPGPKGGPARVVRHH